MAKEIFEFIDRIFQGSISGWEMNLAEGGGKGRKRVAGGGEEGGIHLSESQIDCGDYRG